jgi:hypothetical protein
MSPCPVRKTNWQVASLVLQGLVQRHAVGVGHPEIEHEAGGPIVQGLLQEFRRGPVRQHLVAGRSEQPREGSPDVVIVIHDHDQRRGNSHDVEASARVWK